MLHSGCSTYIECSVSKTRLLFFLICFVKEKKKPVIHLKVRNEHSFSQAQTSQIQSMLINFNDTAEDKKLKTRQEV